jgi:hypothetical protein
MIPSVRVPPAIPPLNPPLTMPVAMPGTFGKNFFQPDHEWGFMTVGTRTSHGDALLTLFLCSPCFRSLKSTAAIQHSFGHGKHFFRTIPLSLVVPQTTDCCPIVARVSVAHLVSISTSSRNHLLRTSTVLCLYQGIPTGLDRFFFVLAIEKLGNPGWNWETHLRYSRKSERYVTFQRAGLPVIFVVVDCATQIHPAYCARRGGRAPAFQSCASWNRW